MDHVITIRDVLIVIAPIAGLAVVAGIAIFILWVIAQGMRD